MNSDEVKHCINVFSEEAVNKLDFAFLFASPIQASFLKSDDHTLPQINF
jgi:hypothetical protein